MCWGQVGSCVPISDSSPSDHHELKPGLTFVYTLIFVMSAWNCLVAISLIKVALPFPSEIVLSVFLANMASSSKMLVYGGVVKFLGVASSLGGCSTVTESQNRAGMCFSCVRRSEIRDANLSQLSMKLVWRNWLWIVYN